MAVNPNVDFVAGAILTAAQQNRFGRGVMAYNQVIVSDSSVTAEEVQITGSAFTAVANRYYRITYLEPFVYGSVTSTYTFRIRQTNLAGTLLQEIATVAGVLGSYGYGACSVVTTFPAGSTNVVATLTSSAGTGVASRTATRVAYLMVEDIGPA